MFKRKILPLLMVAAAVVLGLVMPILFPAFRGSLGNSTEALGLELNELSMSSGLTVLEKLTVLSNRIAGNLRLRTGRRCRGRSLFILTPLVAYSVRSRSSFYCPTGGRSFG